MILQPGKFLLAQNKFGPAYTDSHNLSAKPKLTKVSAKNNISLYLLAWGLKLEDKGSKEIRDGNAFL
jgi:hypothetical protein